MTDLNPTDERFVVREYDDEWYGVWDKAEAIFVFPLFKTKTGATNSARKFNATFGSGFNARLANSRKRV